MNGSHFQLLTEALRLDTGLLDTSLPLVKAHYPDFIDRFEAARQRYSSRSAHPLLNRRTTAELFI